MKVARALVNFIDGSYLYIELSKKIDSADTMLCCERVVGLPEGSPQDKPTAAVGILRTAQAGNGLEIFIPMARINGINILEEFLAKQVASDIQALWSPEGPQKRTPGGAAPGGARK